MRLLHCLPTLDPRGGGPMEAVLQTSLACEAMGHTADAATLDALDAPYLGDYPLRVIPLGDARSGGYGYSKRYVDWLRMHASEYDAVIVHGLWQFHGLGAWLALRRSRTPYFVFSHGMLDPYFKRAFPLKHLKKWLYWPWADYRVLRDARAVLFTCEEERRLARKSFWLYRAREVVVAFGTASPPTDAARLREVFLDARPELRGKRLVLFLSRIHPKKGCDLLIDAFARVAGEHPDLVLVMAGPDQAGWQAALEAQARARGIAHRIAWVGMLQGDQKWGAFYASDVYALPSHQENFGIAVAEALACRLPVLISHHVNIWREIAEARAGFVADDTEAGCERMLRDWFALDDVGREEMRANAAALFEQRFTVQAMAESLVGVVEQSVGGASAAHHDNAARRSAVQGAAARG